VDIAPRLLFENRIDDGPTLRAKLVRWPAISPDGKRVAFSSLNKVWLMALPDGKPERLTTGTSGAGEFTPTGSPDRRHLAFVSWSREGGAVYRAASAPGSTPERLTRHTAYCSQPAYTPDGTKIVYLTGTRDDQLYADIRETLSGNHADVLPDDTMASDVSGAAEIGGIGGAASMDLRWIPANGGES